MSAIYNPRDAFAVHPEYLAPLSREDAFQQVLIDFIQALDTFFETDLMTHRLAGRVSIRVNQLLEGEVEDKISEFLRPIKHNLCSLTSYGGSRNASRLASGPLRPLVEAKEKALTLIDPAKKHLRSDLLNLREHICSLSYDCLFFPSSSSQGDLFKWLNRIEVIITNNPSDPFAIVLMQRIDKIADFCRKTTFNHAAEGNRQILDEIGAHATARYKEMDHITEPLGENFDARWIEKVTACGRSLKEIGRLTPALDVKDMQSKSIISLKNIKVELKASSQKLLEKILRISFPTYTDDEKRNPFIHSAAAPAAPPR